jgi:copper chaperone CopZ
MKVPATLIAGALVLAVAAGVWIAFPAVPPVAAPRGSTSTGALVHHRYSIQGMHCEGCAAAITAEVLEIEGVRSVDCTYEHQTAEIVAQASAPREAIERAITKLGYTLVPMGAAPEQSTDQGAAGQPPADGTADSK